MSWPPDPMKTQNFRTSDPTTNHEPDGLQTLINASTEQDPQFADAWAPYAHMIRLSDERMRLGLSQAEVAERMGVGRVAVAKMESDPSGVAFARILSYAQAIGAELVIKPSKQKPRPLAKPSRGRPVKRARAAVA